jgi:glycosyltransferase involved in cell wall biosynthesis
MNIIITSPSLDTNINVSGVSSVTKFIIENNPVHNYIHFILGKRDIDRRGLFSSFRILKAWITWCFIMIFRRDLLVHFNFSLDKRSIIRDAPLILFARVLHKRVILHLHGGEFLDKESIPIWLKKLLILIFSGKEPKIVLSQIEKEIIQIKYNAKNIVVLSNCIDLRNSQEFNRIYNGEPPIKLLFIGRIVLSKGIEYILQALKILKDKEIQFKFIMAGNGPEKNDYVQKFSAILGSDFEFKGVVSGETKTELYKQCNVFLLPSLYGEGLPISLLECMSFEIVPIVTDDGSMKSIIKNGLNGFIVEKGSSDKIAEAIGNVIINKDLMKEIGKNARQYIFENCNPRDYINKLNKIYDNC